MSTKRPVIAFERRPPESVTGKPVSNRAKRKIQKRLRCALPHTGDHTLVVDEPQIRAQCRGCGATYPAHKIHQRVGRGPVAVPVRGLTVLRIL